MHKVMWLPATHLEIQMELYSPAPQNGKFNLKQNVSWATEFLCKGNDST